MAALRSTPTVTVGPHRQSPSIWLGGLYFRGGGQDSRSWEHGREPLRPVPDVAQSEKSRMGHRPPPSCPRWKFLWVPRPGLSILGPNAMRRGRPHLRRPHAIFFWAAPRAENIPFRLWGDAAAAGDGGARDYLAPGASRPWTLREYLGVSPRRSESTVDATVERPRSTRPGARRQPADSARAPQITAWTAPCHGLRETAPAAERPAKLARPHAALPAQGALGD